METGGVTSGETGGNSESKDPLAEKSVGDTIPIPTKSKCCQHNKPKFQIHSFSFKIASLGNRQLFEVEEVEWEWNSETDNTDVNVYGFRWKWCWCYW